MLSVKNIHKQYCGRILLNDATFNLSPGERLGLVGRNGHGKSTLFRIITHEESADSGEVSVPRDYKVGYLRQHTNFTQPTVVAEAAMGIPEGERSWNLWKAEKILHGLGFTNEMFEQSPQILSGGYQLRLNLTQVLVSEPQLLLLDEPTNFLDVVSIRWLREFLRNWQDEMILITHDRSFMDAVCNSIMGIHRTGLRRVTGDTELYYNQIAMDDEVHERGRIKTEKKQQQIQEYVDRFRAKASKAASVQSKIKMLAKMDHREKLSRISTLEFEFPAESFPAKLVMQARDLGFSYREPVPDIVRSFSLDVHCGECIGVIGKNGRGKTTLLKLLTERLKLMTGQIVLHPRVRMAYFEQANTAELNPNNTVEQEIINLLPDASRQRARAICGAMMFSGDDALKKISVLSGGEKSRVLLGKLLATPSNLLILDEPTHHLDMQSTDALIRAVQEYPGGAVVVTHDEMFLRQVATQLVVFHENGIGVFHGTYAEFLADVGWDDEVKLAEWIDKQMEHARMRSKSDSTSVKTDDTADLSGQTKAERVQAYEDNKNQKRMVDSLRKKLKSLNHELRINTDKLEEINASLEEASMAKNIMLIVSYAKEQKAVQAVLDDFLAEKEKTEQRLLRIEGTLDQFTDN